MVANSQPAAAQMDSKTAPEALPPMQPTSDFVYMTVLLGMPGSMVLALVTALLALSYGEGFQLVWWLGLAAAWGTFFTLMGAAWFGQANESVSQP